MDLLLQSIHHFSERPVVVANFGALAPASWTPERFPRLVLLHARNSTANVDGHAFNLNKLTTMLFTKVKTGIALDGDEFVNRGVDATFQRAADETTSGYPYPI